jgi:hypothetical protein
LGETGDCAQGKVKSQCLPDPVRAFRDEA